MNAPEQIWLRFAAEDLRMAELALAEGIFTQTCFHAQQCVEKALKGLVIKRTGRTPPRTHSIAELLHQLSADVRDTAPANLATALDPYYILTRYPDAIPASQHGSLPNAGEAEHALSAARQAMSWVGRTVGESGRSD